MEIHITSTKSAEAVCTYITAQAKAGRLMLVTIEEPKRLRSLAANARYWVLLTLIAEHVRIKGLSFEKNSWHEYFKQRYLTPQEIALPNGKISRDFPSTATMAYDAFAEYMGAVERWAAERGVIMPDLP